MNSDPLNLVPISRPLELPSLRASLLQLMAAVAKWRERHVQRAQLAQLDAWTQRDLGLSDAEIWRELQKRPWQP